MEQILSLWEAIYSDKDENIKLSIYLNNEIDVDYYGKIMGKDNHRNNYWVSIIVRIDAYFIHEHDSQIRHTTL